MTFKTVSFTPQGDIADEIFSYCRTQTTSPSGERYSWLDVNPQNLVRDSLLEAGIITTKQQGCGDRSCWEPGQPIKTSFYQENAIALTDFATNAGVSKQRLIRDSVMDYLSFQGN